MAKIYCVGCGEDISTKSSDHRNLLTDSASHVFKAWKETMGKELRKKIDEENIEKGIEEIVGSHRMCRRCFSTYNRLHKFQKGVEENAADALDVLLPQLKVTRKRRLITAESQSTTTPSKRTPMLKSPLIISSSSSVKSPIVSVSYSFKIN